MGARAFELKVKKTILAHDMLPPFSRVVLGVSGGPDSTAMLVVMESLSEREGFGWEIHLAHVHHHLRGGDADEDVRHVSRLAEEREKSEMFHVEHFNVAEKAKLEKISVETAGRLCRYEAFERIAREVGGKAVAVGHTADDKAETVLQRIIRGTGLRGLGGIPAKRPISRHSDIFVVRPLIECFREEVMEYLKQKGVTVRVDASNVSADYERNRIRNELLPLLESGYNRKVKQALLRLARIASAANDFVESEARRHMAGEATISAAEVRGLPEALELEVLRQAIESAGLSADLDCVEEALGLLRSKSPSGAVHLAGGMEVKRSYGRVEVRGRRVPGKPLEPAKLTVPGEACFGEYAVRSEVIRGKDFGLSEFVASKGAFEETIDGDAVGHELLVRSRKSGDRYQPLGAPGEKKLKEVLIDKKVPREERDGLPVIVSGDRIVWVVGVGIAESVKVGPGTKRVVMLSARRRGAQEE